MTKSTLSILCLDCGNSSIEFNPGEQTCPKCGSYWREARYNYALLGNLLPEIVQNRPLDIWKYRELLPIRELYPELSLGEGFTPLIRANHLGLMLGCQNLYIKDERQNPTSSFKDRQAIISIAALKEAGINEAVIASTGNVAMSYSAYAARAGVKLWAFLTSLVPGPKMREVALYGTQVIKVTGSYDQAKKVASEFARQRKLFIDLGARSIACIEGMKTIAYELAEQLALIMNPFSSPELGSLRRVPDWYIQSVSGGMGPIGVLKGYWEMKEMGWVDRVPKIGCIQVEGCSPMVQAWKQNSDIAQPVQSPRTLIATLGTGDPGKSYTLLRKRMLDNSGGIFESVTDEEAFRALHIVAKMEGLSIEPAAAVAFAGLIKLVRSGQIKPTDVIVVNNTGHTMPIERNILGEGWARNIVLSSQAMEDSPEEGLLSALSKVSLDRFPRILVVDDTPDARRLITRILHSQGNFTIYEATNGKEALEVATKEQPSLIILDLMMPEMDGFGVLDRLKSDADTADIPVIVVTAKELTQNEKDRLQGQIQSLMQKGDFLSDDLLDEVRSLIR
jgi:threonine synthase